MLYVYTSLKNAESKVDNKSPIGRSAHSNERVSQSSTREHIASFWKFFSISKTLKGYTSDSLTPY